MWDKLKIITGCQKITDPVQNGEIGWDGKGIDLPENQRKRGCLTLWAMTLMKVPEGHYCTCNYSIHLIGIQLGRLNSGEAWCFPSYSTFRFCQHVPEKASSQFLLDDFNKMQVILDRVLRFQNNYLNDKGISCIMRCGVMHV